MKLIIQIPCFNEEETLPGVLAGVPNSISGVDEVVVLVIDDGSTDRTSEVAREHGAHHVVRNTGNLGLAFSFRRGLEESLTLGADIVVNLDGDHQYKPEEIPELIEPLLSGKADIVIGNRQTDTIEEFSPLKRYLQRVGTKVVRWLSKVEVDDVTSGFRAFTSDAAIKLTVLSNYTYTLETILQARSKGLIVENVKISTNPKTRESRLMSSIGTYITFSIATIIRVFMMYNPLKVFLYLGGSCILLGSALFVRFLYFYFTVGGQGKVQSLVIGATFLILGGLIALVGMLADIIQFNRRLQEETLILLKKERADRLRVSNH